MQKIDLLVMRIIGTSLVRSPKTPRTPNGHQSASTIDIIGKACHARILRSLSHTYERGSQFQNHTYAVQNCRTLVIMYFRRRPVHSISNAPEISRQDVLGSVTCEGIGQIPSTLETKFEGNLVVKFTLAESNYALSLDLCPAVSKNLCLTMSISVMLLDSTEAATGLVRSLASLLLLHFI